MTLDKSEKTQVARLFASLAFALSIAGALSALLFWPSRTKAIAPVAAPPTRPQLLDVPYVPAESRTPNTLPTPPAPPGQ